MTELSTHQKKLYVPYEVYHHESVAESGTGITITGKQAHADVCTATYSPLRTRVYVNGKRNLVSGVANAGADIDITVADSITLGDSVHVFIATTTGTLYNNTTTGKFPFAKLQVAQRYNATSNVNKQSGCGSTRIHRISYVGKGAATLAFIRHGNSNMKNFTLAAKNSKFLMFIVKDTTDAANTTYEILHEARVKTCVRGTRATNAKGSEVVDVVEFTFVPDVSPST